MHLDESAFFATIRETVRRKEQILLARMVNLKIDLQSVIKRRYLAISCRTCQFLAVSAVAISIWSAAFLLLALIFASLFDPSPAIPRSVLILYIYYLSYDDSPTSGGRPVPGIRRADFWKYFRDYFPIQVIKQKAAFTFKPSHTYMIGYHPHGVSGLGAFGAFGSRYAELDKIFPGIELFGCTLESNFNIPILREFLLAMGGVSVSEKSIKSVLARGPGNAVVVVPGGAAEALHAKPGSHELTLKKRTGFFRIAIETGSHLIPVYSFGENEIFDQVCHYPAVSSFNSWMVRKLGFFLPLYSGCGAVPLNPVPKRSPIITVVGQPIEVEKKLFPTREDIEVLKCKYITRLCRIFDDFADVYAPLRSSNLNFAE